MEKINIAELLKDCPNGMELDCTMYEDVYFDYVDVLAIIHCYIQHETHKTSITFNQYGTPNSDIKSKCVIFPKGQTTWKGFQRPFKDGDVVTSVFQGVVQGTGIFDHEEQTEAWIHVCINLNNEFSTDGYLGYVYDLRFATEEEKQKLFQAIKDNGYKWNEETKTLEKHIKLKFNVGDRISKKESRFVYTVTDIKSDRYELNKTILSLRFCDEHEWELVPNKFDPKTLKPFDRVLVRDCNSEKWKIDFFDHYVEKGTYYQCMTFAKNQCIPYVGNEHLRGTTNDCDEFYKIWK